MTHPAITRLLALGGELAPGSERRKYDLAHMRTLLHALGDPQLRLRSVLIAGTNGKGSTAATLASILQAAGHRTGLYTSPHLEQPNERIRIDGLAISDAVLAARFTQVETASARLVASGELPHTPSFFETVTAIAFLHFAAEQSGQAGLPSRASPSRQTSRDGQTSEHGQTSEVGQTNGAAHTIASRTWGHPERSEGPAVEPPALSLSFDNTAPNHTPVDIAILEVGLGGRLDATNVVEPLLSILTDISIDHTAWLGHTLPEITREKAGILRPHGTLITLPQHPEANQTIGEIAVPLKVHAISASDYLPPRTGDPEPATSLTALLRNRYALSLPPGALSNASAGPILHVDSPLAGTHQQRNLALALAAAITLHQQHGYALTLGALEQGLRDTLWPGRLQLLHPPANHSHHAPILLDAAHNPAGAWALRAALAPLPILGPRTLVFGCMADKAIAEIAQILFPVFDEVLLTHSTSVRAASVEQLAAAAEPTGTLYRTFSSAPAALAAAQAATPAHGLVVLAGSIALLGELTAQLRD